MSLSLCLFHDFNAIMKTVLVISTLVTFAVCQLAYPAIYSQRIDKQPKEPLLRRIITESTTLPLQSKWKIPTENEILFQKPDLNSNNEKENQDFRPRQIQPQRDIPHKIETTLRKSAPHTNYEPSTQRSTNRRTLIEKENRNDPNPEMNERLPLYAPDKCPEDQLLYPGDQESDWICDCGPGHVYYPGTDKCYPIYTRGPCNKSDHLVLKKGKVVPECAKNPCEEGWVKYQGDCYELESAGGPCPPVNEGGGLFGVNWTTLEVGCLIGTEPLSLFKVPNNCPPGSRRDSANKCRENFNV